MNPNGRTNNMKLIDVIVGFFKSLFGKKSDGNCDDCSDRTVCQTTDKNKKYAVIVGMETSKWGGCPGADKDSNTMLALIKQYVDNNQDHIKKLNNKTATVDAVRAALNEQIAKVPEDGLFIFTYSGHGGQYNKSASASNETDGRDEFLCLFDGPMIDDELWTIMNQCKGRVVCCYDCCHSSTMYRLPGEEPGFDEEAEEREPLEKPFFAKYENVRAGIRMLVFSGCGEDTVSWGDRNGGAMTTSMNRAFNKCLTYREWWNKFKTDQALKKVKQTPICTRIGGFDLNAKVFN